MTEDRLKKDYDLVENLGDLIKAREERESAFSDDLDAMDDIALDSVSIDAQDKLTVPHPRSRAEDDRLGLGGYLMGTPDERDVEFDWQDSVEEMLPADPETEEGMGEDSLVEPLAHVAPGELAGPLPSVEEGGTEESRSDGGEPVSIPTLPVQMDSAMDTDSDEVDFSIDDRFRGQIDRETAIMGFEEMRRAIAETSRRRGRRRTR